jgi:hypothetical protein
MQPSQQKRRRLDDKELIDELAATNKLASASSTTPTGKGNRNSSRSQSQPQGDVGLYSPLPPGVITGASTTKQQVSIES